MADLAFIDTALVCNSCGHPGDFHRTKGGACTYEVLDYDGSWIRCDCEVWL